MKISQFYVRCRENSIISSVGDPDPVWKPSLGHILLNIHLMSLNRKKSDTFNTDKKRFMNIIVEWNKAPYQKVVYSIVKYLDRILVHISWGFHPTMTFIFFVRSKTFVFFLITSGEYLTRYEQWSVFTPDSDHQHWFLVSSSQKCHSLCTFFVA